MADDAQTVLAPLQVDNSIKADAWEAFNSSKNETELQMKLMGMKGLPDGAKADLWEMKHKVSIGAPSPITDTSTISAKPSLGSRVKSAYKAGGIPGVGQELGEATRNAVANLPLPGVGKTVGQGLTDLGQMANMAGTTAAITAGPEDAAINAVRGLGSAIKSPVRYLAGKVFTVNPATGASELSPWAEALMHPSKIPEAALKKLGENVPIGPSGLSAADRMALEQRAQDLMRRPDALSQAVKEGVASRIPTRMKPPTPSPFQGMTSSAQPIGSAQLPETAITKQPPVEMVKQFSKPEPSRVQLPGSQPANVKVTYQSYPRAKLYEMAKTGDINAGLELIRNPKGFELPPNFKYLIEAEAKKLPWRDLEK